MKYLTFLIFLLSLNVFAVPIDCNTPDFQNLVRKHMTKWAKGSEGNASLNACSLDFANPNQAILRATMTLYHKDRISFGIGSHTLYEGSQEIHISATFNKDNCSLKLQDVQIKLHTNGPLAGVLKPYVSVLQASAVPLLMLELNEVVHNKNVQFARDYCVAVPMPYRDETLCPANTQDAYVSGCVICLPVPQEQPLRDQIFERYNQCCSAIHHKKRDFLYNKLFESVVARYYPDIRNISDPEARFEDFVKKSCALHLFTVNVGKPESDPFEEN